MEGNNELLRMELTEHNTFARHHFQLYLSWYTFFLTVNFAVIGWFTNDLLTGALKVSLPIVIIATFFLIQLILSYLASLKLRNYFETTHNRCNELLKLLADLPPESNLQARTAIPLQVYLKIIGLMCSTLISFCLFWIALAVVSIYRVPL